MATWGHVATWGWSVVVALLSMLAALCLPQVVPIWMTGAPGMVFFLMFFSQPVATVAMRLARKRLAAEPA